MKNIMIIKNNECLKILTMSIIEEKILTYSGLELNYKFTNIDDYIDNLFILSIRILRTYIKYDNKK